MSEPWGRLRGQVAVTTTACRYAIVSLLDELGTSEPFTIWVDDLNRQPGNRAEEKSLSVRPISPFHLAHQSNRF